MTEKEKLLIEALMDRRGYSEQVAKHFSQSLSEAIKNEIISSYKEEIEKINIMKTLSRRELKNFFK